MEVAQRYYQDLLLAVNWDRAAALSGNVAFLSCVGFGLTSLFHGGHFILSIFTLVVGGLIGLWEVPSLYNCHVLRAGPLGEVDVEQLKSRLLEDYKMKYPRERGLCYLSLGFSLLFNSSYCFYSGLILFLSGVCFFVSSQAGSNPGQRYAFSELGAEREAFAQEEGV